MKGLKYFTFMTWIILCAALDTLVVPSDFKYIFGFVAGTIALAILNMFDIITKK